MVWVILLLMSVVGVAAILFSLAGQLLFPIAAALLALWLDPPPLPWSQVGLVLGAGVAAEILEQLLGMWGSQRAGGSAAASWGALLGGFAGAVLGTLFLPVPLVGSLVGALLGTFLGAAIVERSRQRPSHEALRVGAWALLGRIIGLVVKSAVALSFLVYSLVQLFRASFF